MEKALKKALYPIVLLGLVVACFLPVAAWCADADEVEQAMPDLIVSRVGLKEGRNIPKGSIVHPYCQATNLSNVTAGASRLAYYIDADQYRDDDGVDALCPRCSSFEEVLNDNIKLGDTGSRTLKCCVDYLQQVPESRESNNCRTISFAVY